MQIVAGRVVELSVCLWLNNGDEYENVCLSYRCVVVVTGTDERKTKDPLINWTDDNCDN